MKIMKICNEFVKEPWHNLERAKPLATPIPVRGGRGRGAFTNWFVFRYILVFPRKWKVRSCSLRVMGNLVPPPKPGKSALGTRLGEGLVVCICRRLK